MLPFTGRCLVLFYITQGVAIGLGYEWFSTIFIKTFHFSKKWNVY